MAPRLRLAVLAVASMVLLAALAIVLFARPKDEPASANGFAGAVRPEIPLRTWALTDQDGRTVRVGAPSSGPSVVTFLYTHCQDSCPAQAQLVRGALDDLGKDVPAIAIAVDPPNDTPRSARAFLSEQHALGRIHFVLGTRAQLRPLWRGFFVREQLPTQEHQERTTLVDKRGYQRIGFPGQEATSETVAHDVRLLQNE
jgi:protein SCO1